MYVIMMDEHIDQHPDEWPIAVKASTLGAARARKNYDGSPDIAPKDGVGMMLIEPKKLKNLRTGAEETGAIYKPVVASNA